MRCKICQSPTDAFGRAQVLGKYEVQYYSCPACGFIQTEEPYWLDEAYAAPIGAADVGLLSRNIVLSRILKALIERFFDRGGRFLDYGGGYGVLVRLMRDQGYDFYRSDPLCPNLFAQGFDAPEGRPAQPPYELVTAFEVAEHLANPHESIAQMLAYAPSLLLSTTLVPPGRPRPGEWWYYALEGGQHISLYTRRSLAALGQRHGLRLYTNGASLHLLTPRRISESTFSLISRYHVATLLNLLARRPSLTMPDMRRALNGPR